MKKQKYRIIGVIAILTLVASIIFIPQVFAAELWDVEENLTCADLEYKYGLYIERRTENDVNTYVLHRDPTADGDCPADANGIKPENDRLQITKINGISQFNGDFLDYGEEIVLGGENLLEYYGSTATITVELTKIEEEEENTEEENQSFWGSILEGLFSDVNTITVKHTEIAEGSNGESITINKSNATTSKDWQNVQWNSAPKPADFDAVKNAAQALGGKHYKENFSAGTILGDDSLKCKPEIKNYTDNSDNYYRSDNTSYYYASQTTNTGSVQYEYNYAPGNTKKVTQTACKRTCEEAVKVEYGMPVASKAGLCFEYTVKVTSYVTCQTTDVADPPQDPSGTNYCNPAPKCISESGVLRKKPQAGPTDDFDDCINTCDGGKYSEKCSLKCYKQVYGIDLAKKLNLNYEDNMMQKMASTIDTGSYSVADCLKNAEAAGETGCYSKNGSTIKWHSIYNTSRQISYDKRALGRWYLVAEKNSGYNLSNISTSCNSSNSKCYVVDGNGFYRRNYESGLCTDICSWQNNCGSESYLNSFDAQTDYENNIAEYEKAMLACEAAASCSTSTAEFVIKASYNKKDGNIVKEVQEVFPTSPPETLRSNAGDNPSFKSNTPILDWNGCYRDENAKNTYMTEWGFPGTWIHNKTGEISYKGNPGEGYYFESGKFCTPLNALSVNTKWWEYAETNCLTATPTPEQWNIEASTENFGYFGWNFKISCFYALRNEVCNTKINGCCSTDVSCKPGDPASKCDPVCNTPDCPTEDKEPTVINYRIRSIDLENPFPYSGTGVTENKRKIGFNWTSAAKNTKNSGYTSDPEALITAIENSADTIYNQEPDYSFELTPENLKRIRKYNNDKDYTKYGKDSESNTILKNGINAYKSDFIRNSEYVTNRKTGTIGVNNE